MAELYNHINRPEYAGLANAVSSGAKGISPASPIDEVRDALSAAKSLAYQIAALTDTLCGALPESTSGHSDPKPGAIIPDLAHHASETSMAIAKANIDINRLMRAFGI